VGTIFENLEDGMSIEEIMEQFDVTREQVKAVLDFARAEPRSSGSPLMLGQAALSFAPTGLGISTHHVPSTQR